MAFTEKMADMIRNVLLVVIFLWTVVDASSSNDDHGGGHSDDVNATAGPKRFQVVSLNWHHVHMPLTVAMWIFIVICAKIVFHLSQRFAAIFPDSALLIVLGLLIGGILYVLGLATKEFYLNPDLFFLFLLPPIVLDAGYFLPTRAFFQNIFTILIYAVFGTLWNTASIGLTLYFCRGWFTMEIGIVDIFLFAALISAVDPVAVLCVFEEIHVNELLYICVFGESLLNDAVTVVLYNMLGAFAEIRVENLLAVDFAAGFASFFVVALGGVFVGLVWALFTGYTTKYTQHLTVLQPLICLVFPYLAYLLSEMVHISGILAIVTCGHIMKQYLRGNISRKSQVTVNYFLKTLSSCCEAIIFVFLGLSTISESHYWDTAFVFVTIAACLVFRFIGVFALTALVNWRRMEKIDYVDQFIMAYGGLRGAVCYGLVMAIDQAVVPAKDMYVTATIAVILFTVFVQGLTIKPMVYWLHVKLAGTEKKKTVTERMFDNMQDHILAGMEEVIGYHGHHWFKNTFENIHTRYILPRVCRTPRCKGSKILETYESLNVKEAIMQLRKYGNHPPDGPDFAGNDTAHIANKMLLQSPWQKTAAASARQGAPVAVVAQPVPAKAAERLPKVTSLATLLKEALPPVADIRRYSRHLLDEDVEENSMQPRLVRQRAMRSIEEEDPAAEKALPLRARHARLTAPPLDAPSDGRRYFRSKSVDDRAFDNMSDSEFITIPGALRTHPGSNVPVLPVFFVRRDTISHRSQSERHHRPLILKAATIATSENIDETPEDDLNFTTARTTQNTARVLQRSAKSADTEEMSSLITPAPYADSDDDNDDRSKSKDDKESSL